MEELGCQNLNSLYPEWVAEHVLGGDLDAQIAALDADIRTSTFNNANNPEKAMVKVNEDGNGVLAYLNKECQQVVEENYQRFVDSLFEFDLGYVQIGQVLYTIRFSSLTLNQCTISLVEENGAG